MPETNGPGDVVRWLLLSRRTITRIRYISCVRVHIQKYRSAAIQAARSASDIAQRVLAAISTDFPEAELVQRFLLGQCATWFENGNAKSARWASKLQRVYFTSLVDRPCVHLHHK